MKRNGYLLIFLISIMLSCTSSGGQVPTASASETAPATFPSTNVPFTETFTPLPPTSTTSPTPALTFTPLPTDAFTPSPLPVVERIKAKVTAERLSCRYGPGAEYLYLYALRVGANIQLIGRTDANDWVWVDGTNKCWVKSTFLEIAGDRLSLPIVYPGIAKLPITPYYPPASWANARRSGNTVEVNWEAVPISPGKFEDENMHQYIVEVWRCENGQILFETLGTNFPFITIENDEAGCAVQSHGNVWVQEKHGFAGPTEIPWPTHPTP